MPPCTSSTIRQAIVATTDFFTPIVDDPRDFGRIAATNALSDVYAMGGTPIMALAIVGMPLDKLPREVIRRDPRRAAQSVCARGRHSDRGRAFDRRAGADLRPGRPGRWSHPDARRATTGAKAGDVLILGKPLGIGILSAALKKGRLSADGYAQMIAVDDHAEHASARSSPTSTACTR